MTGRLTQYGANQVLDGVTIPSTLYVQLHTGNPGTAGTTNVATETDRISFVRNAASSGATANTFALDWNDYPASEAITHISVWDASSAGNCWAVSDLVAPVGAEVGYLLSIASGSLDITIQTWS